MRADTAARGRAIDVLKAGLAEGRLTRAEHDERAARVRVARTYDDLARLVAGLPSGVPVAGVPAALGYYPVAGYPPGWEAGLPEFNSLAVASLICGLVEIPTLGLTALPAIILADRARQQIRETGQRGAALAVAGRALGWAAAAVFLLAILALMIWLAMPPAPGTSGPVG